MKILFEWLWDLRHLNDGCALGRRIEVEIHNKRFRLFGYLKMTRHVALRDEVRFDSSDEARLAANRLGGVMQELRKLADQMDEEIAKQESIGGKR